MRSETRFSWAFSAQLYLRVVVDVVVVFFCLFLQAISARAVKARMGYAYMNVSPFSWHLTEH